MQVQENTPTKEITIQGYKLSVPQPYTEGHVLTEAESAVLNQTLAENLRNNFASQMRKAKDNTEKEGGKYEPDSGALQSELDEYVGEYEFGVRRQSSGGASTAHLDPIEKEIMSLAKKNIRAAIQQKGHKIKDVPQDTINALVEKYAEENKEALRASAEQIVASREAVANVGQPELDI